MTKKPIEIMCNIQNLQLVFKSKNVIDVLFNKSLLIYIFVLLSFGNMLH